MAKRTTKVTLTAQVSDYISGMKEAAQAARETASESERFTQQADAFKQLGVASLAVGAAAATGVGLAVAKWADFDRAMSNVQAATMESEENMQRLSDAALEAGARTVFSAEESANAIEELAKAGVSTADILNGALDGALDLAAAGGLGVAEAAGIAATALKTFKLEGSDMAHVADLLAAGAGKAMGDVTDLSAALNQSAMVANATGLSIEETTAGLAAFASQGLLGSDAGTSFKSMLQSLTPTSAKAATTMQELGISAYDSSGNFIGLAAFAGQLEGALKNLTVEQQQAALKTIFGSDAIRAATVLYSEGEQGIREWIDAVDDQGYAAEQAAARLDNLKGDVEALGGALDTALIQTGSAANAAIREMIQWVTSLIEAYTELPPELQSLALWTGVVVAAVGLLGGGFLLAVPKIAAFKVALAELEITSTRVAGAIAGIAPAAIALATIPVAAALVQWIDDIRETTVSASDLESQLRSTSAASSELERGLTGGSAFRGLGMDTSIADNNLRMLNSSLGQVKAWFDNTSLGMMMSVPMLGLGREAGNTQKQIEELDAALSSMASSGDTEAAASAYEYFAQKAEAAGWSTEKIAEALPLYTEAAKSATPEVKTSADVAKEAAAGYMDQANAARAATDELFNLIDALMESNSVAQGAENANARYQQTLADVAEYIANAQAGLEGYSTSLDENTVEGSKNRAMFAGMAADSQAAAQAIMEQEVATVGSEQALVNYNARLAEGRDALINQITALTGNYDAAVELAAAIYAIPDEQTTRIAVETAAAVAAVDGFVSHVERMRPTITITAAIQDGSIWKGDFPGSAKANGGIVEYANGGIASYAGGGVHPGIYSGGEPIIKFAEPETGWESFISGKISERDRNRQIWVETGNRLDVWAGLDQKIATAVAKAGGGKRGRTIHNTFVNPTTRDPITEAWDGSK
ncbi:phage tail tape measure protein [bacterium]|nr:phage tail tape measure protein [bacterium]